jgi:HemX protein
MVTTLHGLALLLYLLTAGGLARSLVGGGRGGTREGSALLAAAVLVHGAALTAYAVEFGELPLVGLAPSLSVLGFMIGALLLAATLVREARPLGLVLVPLIAAMLVIGLALGVQPAGEALAFRGLWFSLHVVLGFIGCAGLALAFAAGLLYLVQFRELKGKRFGRLFRFLPSLEALDRLGHHALVTGFPAFTLALLLGWAWTVRFQHSFVVQEADVIWGVFTWLSFVVMLLVRRTGVGCERRGAVASVVGFLMVVLVYVALRVSVAEGRLFL